MRYELLTIIPATLTDEDVGSVETAVKALLEKYGATVESMSRLGKFRLAYPIKQVRHGHYVLGYFTAETGSLSKIEEALRIAPNVLRHLTLRADEAGGDKFDLVQFQEINLDNKETPGERRHAARAERKPGEDIKSGVAAIEGATAEAKVPAAAPLSDEEINKKIDAAIGGAA